MNLLICVVSFIIKRKVPILNISTKFKRQHYVKVNVKWTHFKNSNINFPFLLTFLPYNYIRMYLK